MKFSAIKMIAVFTAVCLLSASAVLAKNGGNGGNHGGNGGNRSMMGGNHNTGGLKLSLGSNPSRQSSIKSNNFFKKDNFKTNNVFKNDNFKNDNFKKDIFKKDNFKVNNFVKSSKFDCHDGHCYPKYNCYNGYCYPYYNSYCYPYYRSYCYPPLYAQVYTIPTVVAEVGQAFEPFHSSYIVLPGDSFPIVSLKEYGTSANANYIAQFNGMSPSTALVPGQTLMLPSISANGLVSPSQAPAAEALQNAPIGSPAGNPIANFGQTTSANFGPAPGANFGQTPGANLGPAMSANFNPSMGANLSPTASPSFGPMLSNAGANISSTPAPAAEPPRSKVSVGSTLLVDGQSFGDSKGSARLRVSGLSLPIEVIEWTGGAVKIRLPQVDLTSATNADIEVLRADGSLASKTAVELSAATQVALTK